MSYFQPGREVFSFPCKTGEIIRIRYPQWDDIDALVPYINLLSQEDTYITFSGEVVSRDEEVSYLSLCYQSMERGDSVTLFAFQGSVLVGSADVYRVQTYRKRARHVGKFGITLAKEFRGLGIGKTLSTQVLTEAKIKIPELEMITLDVFSENNTAIRLYEQLGFHKTGTIPNGFDYKGRRQDTITMVKSL